MSIPFERALLEYAEAMALGRQGSHQHAAAAVDQASAALAQYHRADGYRHLCMRWVAEAAIQDAWGDPVRWLREAVSFFEQSGHSRVAGACRRLLGTSGAPMPRRGRGTSVVPPELARLGITSREVDVLTLLGSGLANRDIAERLYLSARTVEKHVERLMDKTGIRSRQGLADLARGTERLQPEHP